MRPNRLILDPLWRDTCFLMACRTNWVWLTATLSAVAIVLLSAEHFKTMCVNTTSSKDKIYLFIISCQEYFISLTAPISSMNARD